MRKVNVCVCMCVGGWGVQPLVVTIWKVWQSTRSIWKVGGRGWCGQAQPSSAPYSTAYNYTCISKLIVLGVAIVHTCAYLTEALLHMFQQMLQTWTVKQNCHECWQHLENSPEGIKNLVEINTYTAFKPCAHSDKICTSIYLSYSQVTRSSGQTAGLSVLQSTCMGFPSDQ